MSVTVIPIVVSALEIVPKGKERGLAQMEIRERIETILTPAAEIGQNTKKSSWDMRRLAVT